MNIAITRLIKHKLPAALVDDRVSPYIKELIQKILDNKVRLDAVRENKHTYRMVYQLSDNDEPLVILDVSGDVNTLSYHDCTWSEIPEDEIDCQWAVNQLTSYLALTDCLVYLAAVADEDIVVA